MNHYFKCIDIRHGTSLGPGDSSMFIWNPWGSQMVMP